MEKKRNKPDALRVYPVRGIDSDEGVGPTGPFSYYDNVQEALDAGKRMAASRGVAVEVRNVTRLGSLVARFEPGEGGE